MDVRKCPRNQNQPLNSSPMDRIVYSTNGKEADALISGCTALWKEAPIPVVLVSGGDQLVRYVNPAFCALLGKPKEAIDGQSIHELLPGKGKGLKLLEDVFLTGNATQYREAQDSDTSLLSWAYLMWPVDVGEGRFGVILQLQVSETGHIQENTLAMNEALILGSVRQHKLAEASDRSNTELQAEVTERKRVEVELQGAKKQLEDRAGQLESLVLQRTAELRATNSQLEAFVYTIAHDLRAPLRAMQGFSSMLLEECTVLSEGASDYAKRISKAAEFMDAMLGDLLDFSRVSQLRVKLTPVSLEPLVESVLVRLQKEIQDKKAQVENIGPWPAVLAHEMTLRQVLFNLVSNALKFTDPDKKAPSLRLWTETRGPTVRVWVEDNGIGIDAAHRDQIFRPFTRLHGERYGGTGIGLAIVKKGVERMGGLVGVESVVGGGCRFWLDLGGSK